VRQDRDVCCVVHVAVVIEFFSPRPARRHRDHLLGFARQAAVPHSSTEVSDESERQSHEQLEDSARRGCRPRGENRGSRGETRLGAERCV
jgi:hypothetical protein